MKLCDTCLRPVRIAPECSRCKPGAGPDPKPHPEEWEPVDRVVPPGIVKLALETLLPLGEEGLTDDEAALVRVVGRGWVTTSRAAEFAALARRISREHAAIAENAERERLKENAEATGAHLGADGERVLLTLWCTGMEDLGEGDYGQRFLLRFRGPQEQEVVWFTGEDGKFAPRPGGTYTVRATCKHSVYRGVRQTVISRPSEVDPNAEPKPKARRKPKTS